MTIHYVLSKYFQEFAQPHNIWDIDLRFHAIHSVKHNRFMYVHLYYWRYSKQEASEFSYDYRVFIFEFNVQTSCVLSLFQELVTSSGQRQLYLEGGRLESYGKYDISPVSGPPGADLNSSRLVKILLAWVPRQCQDWCSENAKRLIYSWGK